MRAIFISYRRDDAEGQAGRLFKDLVERFGAEAVFMDVADIEPGRDFRRAIDQQVASCGVLLALIGKGWLEARDDNGRRRLDDPDDFVRLETSTALKRDIPVVPVLVQDARMPKAEQLPPELADLAYRNAMTLSHARWDSDLQLLVNALARHIGITPQDRAGGSRRNWLLPSLGALAVAGAAGAFFMPTTATMQEVAPPTIQTGSAATKPSAPPDTLLTTSFEGQITTRNPCTGQDFTVNGTTLLSIHLRPGQGAQVSQHFKGSVNGLSIELQGTADFPRQADRYEVPLRGEGRRGGVTRFTLDGLDEIRSDAQGAPTEDSLLRLEGRCA